MYEGNTMHDVHKNHNMVCGKKTLVIIILNIHGVGIIIQLSLYFQCNNMFPQEDRKGAYIRNPRKDDNKATNPIR